MSAQEDLVRVMAQIRDELREMNGKDAEGNRTLVPKVRLTEVDGYPVIPDPSIAPPKYPVIPPYLSGKTFSTGVATTLNGQIESD